MSAVKVLKTLGKGEIARYKQFLLFPVFSTRLENFLPFSSSLNLSSANSLNLEESKISRLGKGLRLTLYHTILIYYDPEEEA